MSTIRFTIYHCALVHSKRQFETVAKRCWCQTLSMSRWSTLLADICAISVDISMQFFSTISFFIFRGKKKNRCGELNDDWTIITFGPGSKTDPQNINSCEMFATESNWVFWRWQCSNSNCSHKNILLPSHITFNWHIWKFRVCEKFITSFGRCKQNQTERNSDIETILPMADCFVVMALLPQKKKKCAKLIELKQCSKIELNLMWNNNKNERQTKWHFMFTFCPNAFTRTTQNNIIRAREKNNWIFINFQLNGFNRENVLYVRHCMSVAYARSCVCVYVYALEWTLCGNFKSETGECHEHMWFCLCRRSR